MLREDDYVLLDSCGGPKRLPPADKPRVLWSHAPFRFLPLDLTAKKVKLVYITRNPKDVFVSMYCFLHKFDPPLGYRGTWEQFFPFMLKEGWWYGNMFDYLLDWDQEIENHPDIPVYRISYEDTLRDTVGQVEKLNEFLGTNRDTEFCREVADACSFSKIPQIRQLSASVLRDNCNWKEGVPFTDLYRKGVVGDWKNWFTVAQNEEFDRVYREKMADSKITFTFE
nr:hypothetical protein BaRGS_027561 [Batillaria attramentaria]